MFDIRVAVPSSQTAFDTLTDQIIWLGWCRKNNRPQPLEYYQQLNNPIINIMLQDCNMNKKAFSDKYREVFETKLYKKDLYTDKISQIKEAISRLQPCYERFEKLNQSWGFEILPQYRIDVNIYGVGGSYYKDNQCGRIVIGMGKIIPMDLAYIIGHEIIHLGIEDIVINPKHLKEPLVKQEEKERIVDNLCIYTMKNILPLERVWKNGIKSNYQEIASSAAYMDKIVGRQPDNNLVLAVQKFLSNRNYALAGQKFLKGR